MLHRFIPHEAVLGDTQIPITYGKDTALFDLQEAGIVGAGGAGFPTYVKYERPGHTLVANGAESEPGFYAKND